MARIFITGSAEGLGLMAGQSLAKDGHEVVLHARSARRAEDARAALPEAAGVLVGDVSTLGAMKRLADAANARGRFDAVIHNVGLGFGDPARIETEDGLSRLWAVNVLAPYVLTASMQRPDRLVYLSSGMHLSGDPSLDDPQWRSRGWNGTQAYADSKLHDLWLAFAVARRWPEVRSNAVSPGWVATRMGGEGASDDLAQGYQTQAWLAAGDDASAAGATGQFFYHKGVTRLHAAAHDTARQDRLLDYCAEVSGITLA